MSDRNLKQVWHRLSASLTQDKLIQTTTNNLRKYLDVDRVVLYYFYIRWEGRVTFESLSDARYSIYGSTGPDECFNGDYASMYEAGRVSAIEDIEKAEIAECHRDFLRQIQVKANLVVPILTNKGLWGLLVAHHCRKPFSWSEAHIKAMQTAAAKLAQAPSISDK